MSTNGRRPPESELVDGDNAGDVVGPSPSEASHEFEFSRLVLGEHVPFELPAQCVDRTWQRLARSTAAPIIGPRVWLPRLGPVVAAAAACAATFAAGVWVGGAKQAPLPPQTVSAEPLALNGRGTGQPAVAGLGVENSTTSRSGLPNIAAEQPPDSTSQAGRVDDRVDDAAHRTTGAHSPSSNRPANWGMQPLVPASAAVAVNTVDSPPVPTAANVNGTPGWQRLANRGDYEAAQAELERAGGFERTLESASADQLMLLSDVARATGQQQRALAALRRIVSEHVADPVAPLAALNMGNLLDKMGDGAGATQAFAVYRTLSPQGDFAEDALVRQIRSAVSAGQPDLAQGLVRQYEADFPEGRRADEVARWAEQIPARSPSTDAGAPDEAHKAE